MHSFIEPLHKELVAVANKERAISAKAYLKNQFEFFGIQMPERRRICKFHTKQFAIADISALEEIIKELFSMKEREFQYYAIELLAAYKKLWQQDVIALMEHCIIRKSWWDTVDFLASDCIGPYFKEFPEKIEKVTGKWNLSDNIWLQRSSLLYQKNYRNNTDLKLFSKYILHLATSKEFVIRKAIGWALREYAKTDPQWVLEFVNQHKLSTLSEREAIKNIK
jgi:3-methyladenine DNA glycosylase AlkD